MMNSTDFHDCMVKNREIYAKEQARLEHIYEQEKAKYNSSSTSNFKATPIQVPQANNNYSDIIARMNKIESRIDKLYEIFGSRQSYSSDGMFVIAPNNANIIANQSITLSDSQFNELMNRLIGD